MAQASETYTGQVNSGSWRGQQITARGVHKFGLIQPSHSLSYCQQTRGGCAKISEVSAQLPTRFWLVKDEGTL